MRKILALLTLLLLWSPPAQAAFNSAAPNIYAYAGNPNGNHACVQASAGVNPPDFVWDITHQQMWVCTTTGSGAGAVWQVLSEMAPVTVASASTVDLGAQNSINVTISGTTTITSFGSTAVAGQVFLVTFSGALTLTYNATSLILPGAASITTAVGDTAIVQALGSGNYRVSNYAPASGLPVVFNGISVQVVTSSGTVTIPAGKTRAVVTMCGASGGGAAGAASSYASTGSGAGGALKKWLSGLTPGLTLNAIVGAAGAAATSGGNNNGGNGGGSQLYSGTQSITSLNVGGGSGAINFVNGPGQAGGGGAANGDVNITGGSGFGLTGSDISTQHLATPGGSVGFGLGTPGVGVQNGGTPQSATAYGYGAGVGGFSDQVNSAYQGPPGSPGVIIIEWYP